MHFVVEGLAMLVHGLVVRPLSARSSVDVSEYHKNIPVIIKITCEWVKIAFIFVFVFT